MPEIVSTYDRLLVSVTLEKREGACALFVQKTPEIKKNIDQVSELPVVVFVLTRPCRGLESFLASSRHLLFR